MKGRRKQERDQPHDAASSRLGGSMLMTGKDRMTFLDLRMLAQMDVLNAAEVAALVEKCAKDTGGTVKETKEAFDKWVEEHIANGKTRCGNCGISAFAGPSKCPFCGDTLQGKTRTPVVSFTSGSREQWNSLCGSFPTLDVVMLVLGVPLFFIGLIISAITSSR